MRATGPMSPDTSRQGVIHYLPGAFVNHAGRPEVIEKAICIHEEDGGLLWKHSGEHAKSDEIWPFGSRCWQTTVPAVVVRAYARASWSSLRSSPSPTTSTLCKCCMLSHLDSKTDASRTSGTGTFTKTAASSAKSA